jgi:hypothetical protein
MVDATIGAFANFETATVTNRGVVANLTEANARLARKLEDCPKEFKEVK